MLTVLGSILITLLLKKNEKKLFSLRKRCLKMAQNIAQGWVMTSQGDHSQS